MLCTPDELHSAIGRARAANRVFAYGTELEDACATFQQAGKQKLDWAWVACARANALEWSLFMRGKRIVRCISVYTLDEAPIFATSTGALPESHYERQRAIVREHKLPNPTDRLRYICVEGLGDTLIGHGGDAEVHRCVADGDALSTLLRVVASTVGLDCVASTVIVSTIAHTPLADYTGSKLVSACQGLMYLYGNTGYATRYKLTRLDVQVGHIIYPVAAHWASQRS